MMSHVDGWMNGWMGGGMWLRPVLGVVVVALLVVLVMKVSRREP